MTRPFPVADFGLVDAVGERILLVVQNLVLQPFLDVSTRGLQPGYPIDHIDGQVKAVGLVVDSQPQRRVDTAASL